MKHHFARVHLTFVILLGLAPLVAVACSTPGSAVVDGPGITGTYTVNGVDALGIEYSGTVVIEATDQSDIYAIQWIVTGAIHEGVGRLSGDTFSATWTTVTSPRGASSGTALYQLDAEGNLIGERRIDGVEDAGTEEIFVDA